MTTYALSGINSTRNSASRSLLFARFLTTAPPTLREATMPTWGRPLSPIAQITLISPDRTARPVRKTVENCAAERSETNGRPWLCGETTATLEAPSLDEGASRTGPHPGAKTVLTLASPHVGLIGALHSEVSPLGRSRYDREDFERLNPTSITSLSATSDREREVSRRDAKSWSYPRNINRCRFGRFPTLHPLLPIIPTFCDPCPARVFDNIGILPRPIPQNFPLLPLRSSGTYTRRRSHAESRTPSEEDSGRDGTAGATRTSRSFFPHPVDGCVDRLSEVERSIAGG